MKNFTLLVVLVSFITTSFAMAKDKRDALPAELVAKIAALPVDQQFQLLVSGPDTEATVALVELTRDSATTLANYDRLMADTVNAKGKLDSKLMYAINREVSCGYPDRRQDIIDRLVICARDAPDGPERRRVFDHLLNYLHSVVMTSQNNMARYSAYELMWKLVYFRGEIIPERGVESLFTLSKHLLTDQNDTLKTHAVIKLAWIAGMCADFRKECDQLISTDVLSPQLKADYQEVFNSVKREYQGQNYITEKYYWEAQAHPVEIVADAVNGTRNHPGLRFAIETILADQNLIDKNYDLLLKYASTTANEDVMRNVSHFVPESAGEAEKKRVDDLLNVYEGFKTMGRYECIVGLRAMLIGGFHKTGSQMAKEGLLPLGPGYQRKRIFAMLLQLLPDTRCHEKAAMALGTVAWIDAETAQTVLTELKKSTPLVDKAIAEAQAAVDFYAQKATTPAPTTAPTPAKP